MLFIPEFYLVDHLQCSFGITEPLWKRGHAIGSAARQHVNAPACLMSRRTICTFRPTSSSADLTFGMNGTKREQEWQYWQKLLREALVPFLFPMIYSAPSERVSRCPGLSLPCHGTWRRARYDRRTCWPRPRKTRLCRLGGHQHVSFPSLSNVHHVSPPNSLPLLGSTSSHANPLTFSVI